MSASDPGPQRSAEAHSASAPYAGDDAFTGGAHGGAGWPGARLESGDAVTAPLVSNVLCSLLGCGSANAVAPGEAGQDRVIVGQGAVDGLRLEAPTLYVVACRASSAASSAARGAGASFEGRVGGSKRVDRGSETMIRGMCRPRDP